MPFNNKEKQILEWGLANGKSRSEVQEAIFRFRTTGSPKAEVVEKRSTGTDVKDFGIGIAKGLGDSAVGIGNITQTIGQGVIAAADPNRTFGQVRDEQGFDFDSVSDSLEATNDIQGTGKTAAFAGEILAGGSGLIRKGLTEGVEFAGKQFGKLQETLPNSLGESVGDKFGSVGKRVSTNLETRKANREAIQALPTKTAQTAVKNGIDINDVNAVNSLFDEATSPQAISQYQDLIDGARTFASNGGRGTDPIEIVGRPIISRVKSLDEQRQVIGKQLGEVSLDLGKVTTSEVTPAVMNRLQSVNGLQGLAIKNSKLDFSNTTLASSLSKSDQTAIQNIFTEAIKGGTGTQKHLLRQELFEILGGKKKSLDNITDTQEKAYEAIRQGLSDVLETRNGQYKELSNEYRKVVQPLSSLRKFLKTEAGEAGDNIDLLEMEAGLLARRLTSTAISRPRVSALLRELDAVGFELGDGSVSTQNLQELYNVLNKYYDIAPKTGFQGQVQGGIEKGGITDRVVDFATSLTKETPEVRQKALDDLFDELIGSGEFTPSKTTPNTQGGSFNFFGNPKKAELQDVITGKEDELFLLQSYRKEGGDKAYAKEKSLIREIQDLKRQLKKL